MIGVSMSYVPSTILHLPHESYSGKLLWGHDPNSG